MSHGLGVAVAPPIQFLVLHGNSPGILLLCPLIKVLPHVVDSRG